MVYEAHQPDQAHRILGKLAHRTRQAELATAAAVLSSMSHQAWMLVAEFQTCAVHHMQLTVAIAVLGSLHAPCPDPLASLL